MGNGVNARLSDLLWPGSCTQPVAALALNCCLLIAKLNRRNFFLFIIPSLFVTLSCFALISGCHRVAECIKHFSLRAYVRARLLPVLPPSVKCHLHTSHTAFWKTQLSTKCTLISSPHHFARHICSPFCGSSTDVQASVIARQLFALQRRVPLCNSGSPGLSL